MNILVCDDDSFFLEYLSKLIEKVLNNNCSITKFSTGYALEMYVDDIRQNNLDILFIDIDLGKENGIEVAKRIKKKLCNIKVIFITGFINYSKNIFETEPTYFLVKPFNYEDLTKALLTAKKAIEDDRPNTLNIVSKGIVTTINIKKIKYVESIKRQVIIYDSEESFTVYNKLNTIEQYLPSNFIRCHQSYIINMDRVKYLNMYFFILQSGEKIPVSQSKYNKTKEIFISYLGSTI